LSLNFVMAHLASSENYETRNQANDVVMFPL